ncbi:MAG: SDR family oxidoreductase, partial [Lachnospiraceae bacterium]|nr:SDR family oxidoreductase [Lachnospiraceae bacterium]
MERLQDKVAIITGGNSGVGAATALLFAKEGAKVVITARRQPQLDEVAAKIREAGGEVLPVVSDISRKGDADAVVAKAVEAYGKVDILVNNAGVLEEGLKPIDRVNDDDLDRILDINTKGTMYCMRAATVEMSKNGSGSIVNVASVAGVMGCGGAAYVSSKAAIIGVTKHTALRFAGTGIRCNAVCPGTIVTPMVAGMNPANMDADMFGQMAKHSDLKVSPCMPEDVAN